jgi:asparagine synthase (glutamine-hydrolysing)
MSPQQEFGGQMPPGLLVAVPGQAPTCPELTGRPAWPDLPEVRLYGGWLPGEVVRARHRSGRLLLVGHCMLSTTDVTAAFVAAMDSGNLDRLTDRTGACVRVIVWDSPERDAQARRTVSVFTDAAGQFPVYVSRRNGETLVGTHPGMLAVHHGRRPDPLTAAARIACPYVLPLWRDRSPYQDVDRCPSGMWLHLGPGSPRREQGPPPLILASRVSRDAGAVELRAALVEAVRMRCARGPVTSDLSGGLDSTSVAFLAARYAVEPVGAITYHNPSTPAQDLADAVRSAGSEPRLRLTTVYGDDHTLPFQVLNDAAAALGREAGLGPSGTYVRLGEPAAGALAWRRSMLRLSQAAAMRARLHLTGEGADALLTAAPSYLVDLAHPATAGRFVRHCAAHARMRDTSAMGLAARAIRTGGIRPARALAGLALALRSPEENRPLQWPDAVTWWPFTHEAAGWLTPSARESLGELVADPATESKLPAGHGPADLASLTELRFSADTHRHLRELGAAVGVAVHAPYLDDPVVRACLGVSPAERVDPHQNKPLLGQALAGLVPRSVTERRTKGDYTAEEYRGARLGSSAIRSMLADSRLADLGVIDSVAVGRTVDRLLAGVAVPLGPLNLLLATEAWLRAPLSLDLHHTDIHRAMPEDPIGEDG